MVSVPAPDVNELIRYPAALVMVPPVAPGLDGASTIIQVLAARFLMVICSLGANVPTLLNDTPAPAASVTDPAPIRQMYRTAPTGNSTDESGGTVTVAADALFIATTNP
jgi:hypothetical protein